MKNTKAYNVVMRENGSANLRSYHVFHLNLKKKWFDMVSSGEKKEEYREIKPYWKERFRKTNHIKVNNTYYPCKWVAICFSNGYAKNRPQFYMPVTGMRFESEGKPEWGAEPNKKYFVLELGEKLTKYF